jgi:hypothetical protein
MNKNIVLTALAFAATALALADEQYPGPSADVEYLAKLLAPPAIGRGMTPGEVHAQFGAPNTQLAPNIWVYWNFKAKDAPRGDQFDAALVIFADNRVQRVRLCDSKPVRAFIAQQEARAAKNAVASK